MAKKKKTTKIQEEKLVIQEEKVITPTPLYEQVEQEVKNISYPISFTEFAEDLDNYTARALKIFANISNLLEEKPREDWEYLVAELKTKPIV